MERERDRRGWKEREIDGGGKRERETYLKWSLQMVLFICSSGLEGTSMLRT